MMSDTTVAAPMSVSLAGVVLDSVDARALASFYSRLLGWQIGDDEDGWATVVAPGGGTHLSFQTEPEYQPPTWPSERTRQQMMLHLDFQVDDLEVAHAHAVAVGATLAPWQPQKDVRVYTDPAGHPFCFFLPGA
jgi:catechol 2,3-dioxygenase-like lactoylglutathione lyase family enzyme